MKSVSEQIKELNDSKCYNCNGDGHTLNDSNHTSSYAETCPSCNGTGKRPSELEKLKNKILHHQGFINEYEERISTLQEKCNHPNKEVTASWFAGDDRPGCIRASEDYKQAVKCPDCEKVWTENQ